MNKYFLCAAFSLVLFGCKSSAPPYESEFGNLTNELYDNGGWNWWHPKGHKYSIGVDSVVFTEGKQAAHIFSEENSTEFFGSLLTQLPIELVQARKLKVTCKLKAEDVTGWAGMWYRVDKPYDTLPRQKGLGEKIYEGIETAVGMEQKIPDWCWDFNNMADDPIRGTTDWKEYAFTFDVPQRSGGVYFGALLSGKGKIWVDDFQYQIVGRLPTDATFKDKSSYIAKPTHLGFETY